MSIEYYQHIDSEMIYACRRGVVPVQLFRLVGRNPGVWKYLPPTSPEWDAVHQYIFWAGKVSSLCRAELPLGTPKVPKAPSGPCPSRESYYLPPGPITDADYPMLAARLQSDRIIAWVVLSEDTYETSLGDGEYHYLHSAHFSEQEAMGSIAAGASQWMKYHLRKMTIEMKEAQFAFPDFNLELFDHYEPAKVLRMLEGQLNGAGKAFERESES